MNFKIQSSYDQGFKDLIKAFNSGLISFDEMCELTLNIVDKVKITQSNLEKPGESPAHKLSYRFESCPDYITLIAVLI